MKPVRIVVATLTVSAAGFIGVLTREDIKTEAYADPVHGWTLPTIGAGSTQGVKRGDKITPLAAVQRAHRELRQFEGELKKCLRPDLTLFQSEWDAYTRIAHNIGPGAFCFNSKGGPGAITKELNAGNYRAACNAILLYDRAGPVNKPSDRCSHPENRTCRGLWKDRLETHALCISDQG